MSTNVPPSANPLNYEGSVAVPYINRTGAPNSGNNSFQVPTLWVDTSGSDAYLLVSKPLGVANWVPIGGLPGQVETLTGDTGGEVPATNNNINILGTAGQITVTGDPGSSTLTLALAGGGTAIDSLIPDSGTSPVVPTAAGAVTMAGAGSITTVGGTNTLTTQLTGLTNHAVLVGAGTTTITKVGPSATVGAPLISAGSSADPAYSTTCAITDATGRCTISVASGSNIVGFYADNSLSGVGNVGSVFSASARIGSTNDTGFFSSGQYDSVTPANNRYWNFGMTPSNSSTPQSFAITFQDSIASPASGGDTLFIADGPQLTATFSAVYLANIHSLPGAFLQIGADNTSTTALSSTRHTATVTEAGGGDAYYLADIGFSTSGSSKLFAFGAQGSSGNFILQRNVANSSGNIMDGTTVMEVDPSTGNVTFSADDVANYYEGIGINTDLAVVNTDTTNAASSARLGAGVEAATAGDPYIQLDILNEATNKFGLDNSASDAFVYNIGSDAGVSGLDGTTVLSIAQSNGLITLPLANGAVGAGIGLALGTGGPTVTSGAGAPTAAQPKGSLYLRTDGSGTNDRAYIATDAVGTWTAIVTVA